MAFITQPQVHAWTREEYHRLTEFGFFEGRRVELVEGQIIDMAAMKSSHAAAVDLVDAVLKAVFQRGCYIRQQKPFVVNDLSEPEPDIAVVPGTVRNYIEAHPTEAALLVEVADTSVHYDRSVKGSLYAKAGIADYWILNLGQLEVYRQPIADETAPHGWKYGEVAIYRPGQRVVPLALESAWVAIEDMLP